MRVAFHTLGCKVNHYETEAMKEAFVSRGAEIVSEEDFADVYIINTCTVTNIADRKSRQFIRRVKKVNPDALVAVTGCYAQVASDEVADMPEVDLVVGNGRKSEICGLVMQKLSDAAEAGAAGSKTDILVSARPELTYYEDMGQVTSAGEGMIRAYLKIQDGCDRFCSYCLIPYARGPVRSRPKAEIIEELGGMLDNGFREIVLTGINTALYGTEEGAECSLSELLTAIDEMPCPEDGDFRIRLSSLEPTVVDKDNVEEIIRHRRLCHHLHLSVQSGSSSVLKAMNRHYDREDYLDIVNAIREYDPLFGLTTDIIVGFPGETEEDFRLLCEFLKEAKFERFGAFTYSQEEDTPAAEFPDQIDEQVKQDRYDILMQTQLAVSEAYNESRVGTTVRVLCEGWDPVAESHYGRSYAEAAEIDGKIWFTTKRKDLRIAEGEMIDVKITEAMDYDLVGEAVLNV